MTARLMQIGEVAELAGLSLRTIRYYEEVGVIAPSARSQGGFRLYSDDDLERLLLIKRMKPLDLSLDEMRDLLDVLDRLDAVSDESMREQLAERLGMYRDRCTRRIVALRHQLDGAEAFAVDLRRASRRRAGQPGHDRAGSPAAAGRFQA